MSKSGNQSGKFEARRRAREAEREKVRQIELGLIGLLFGAADEKSGNVAAIVVLTSVLVAAIAAFQDVRLGTVSDTFLWLAALSLVQLFERKW